MALKLFIVVRWQAQRHSWHAWLDVCTDARAVFTNAVLLEASLHHRLPVRCFERHWFFLCPATAGPAGTFRIESQASPM